MTDLEEVLRMGQACLAAKPVIVLGSGASAKYGIPTMDSLATRIREAIVPSIADAPIWTEFLEALGKFGLERALRVVEVSETLAGQVLNLTWTCIETADHTVLEKLVGEAFSFDLTKLYKHLFNSIHTEVSVITTNYDRLAEYSAEVADFACHTGFGYGTIGLRESGYHWGLLRNNGPARTVNVRKVHGSVDWFRLPDNRIVSLPPRDRPEGLQPLIVTPGLRKYEETHQEPYRSVMAEADIDLANAKAYLCIGYGFNDEHIQPKLLERARRDQVPLVILTRRLTDAARRSVKDIPRYLALEETEDDTIAYSQSFPDGKQMGVTELWDLGTFLNHVLD